MRTSIEDEVVKLFNEKYGIHFLKRIGKLREETEELFEAAGDMEDNPCPVTISHLLTNYQMFMVYYLIYILCLR